MKSERLLTTIAVAALFGASCSNDSQSSSSAAHGGASSLAGAGGQTGGPNGAGATGGGQGGSISTGGSCATAAVAPCGGDVVGTWNVTPSCLAVSGTRNVESIGLGCLTAPVSGTIRVSGSWAAKADGTYTDNTTTTGEEKLSLEAKCLQVSGTTSDCDRISGTIAVLGYEQVTCVPASGGGCSCVGTINQKGGIGLPSSDPAASGGYALASNAIVTGKNPLTQEALQFSYCASNGTMSWTPKVATPTYAGSISFQNGGASGSGGAGGATSSGGSAGSGGSSGSNAAGGAGGATSPGGSAPCDLYEAAKTPCVGRVQYGSRAV
jgi:hypothetical protein